MEINNRGSEWRRWDLHIHTPGTMRNDQYAGSTLEEKWNNFYKAIEDYVGDGTDPEKTIAVLGITDYLSIENYKKVIADKRLPKCIKLVLPNVECRLQVSGAKQPVNYHFIFAPEIVDKLEQRFFAKLKFKYGRDYLATKSELIDLGKAHLGESASDLEAYKKGNANFLLSLSNIAEVFEGDAELRQKTIIAVTNGTNDGLSGIDNRGRDDQMRMTRNAICMSADAIFSGNDADRTYYLGHGKDTKSEVIYQYGSLKPCYHGSDAHSLEKIFNPDQDRYCWIKADTTFEGLKQTLYEPEERVIIQKDYPNTHDNHHVIDYIEFYDQDFPNEKIVFNDYLNCIIGGKSTGKSLLLRSLAYNIDPKYALEQENAIPNRNSKAFTIPAKVLWKDGTDSPRKFVYIPQTYLNSLIDKPEEDSEINKMVFDVLLKKDRRMRNAYDDLLQDKKTISNKLHKNIQLYQDLTTELVSSNNLIAENGAPAIYEKSIEKLTSERIQLMQSFHLDKSEIDRYGILQKERAVMNSRKMELEQEIERLSRFKSPVILFAQEPFFTKDYLERRIPLSAGAIADFLDKVQHYLDLQWKEQTSLLIGSYLKEIDDLKNALIESEEEYKSLRLKIVNNSKLDTLNAKMAQEQEKLEKSKNLVRRNQQIIDEINDCIKNIIDSQGEYYKKYINFVDIVNGFVNNGADTGLTFQAKVIWKKTEFERMISSILDNRRFPSFAQSYGFDLTALNSDNYGSELLNLLWSAIFEEDAEVKLPIKANFSKVNVIQRFFDDWYNIHYEVKSGNDVIDQMSPGKKALVLLELLISLETDKCPILIDQPEDDLDNRSIYNELVEYLKKTKHTRQVILVTHNANVVLGADAEEVIIANQEGVDTANNKTTFEYRSGAIENCDPILGEDGKVLNGVLYATGIQTQICDILEGGKLAFDLRKQKYISVKSESINC